MTETAQRNTKRKPQRVLADARITAYVALGREGKADNQILPAAEKLHTQAMEQRLKSEEGQHWYRRRKAIAELPFGWIKHVLGFRHFSLRGLKKVQGEWQLVCAALNLKRIAALNSA
jgi:hypothetical protein